VRFAACASIELIRHDVSLTLFASGFIEMLLSLDVLAGWYLQISDSMGSGAAAERFVSAITAEFTRWL